MSSYLSSNDDDLFEYEPEEEPKAYVNSTVSDPTTKSELFESIKGSLDNDIESIIGNLDGAKIKLALSYQLAHSFFLSEANKDSSTKTLYIVLDRLTNGDFTLIKMFYELEMKISRRLVFLDISNKALMEKESNDSFLDFVAKTIGVEFNEFYKSTCYKSTWNIIRHAINIDRAVYLTLSKKLGLPVEQTLFDDNFEGDHPVDFETFKNNVHQQITEALLNSGFLEEYSQLTGISASMIINNVE